MIQIKSKIFLTYTSHIHLHLHIPEHFLSQLITSKFANTIHDMSSSSANWFLHYNGHIIKSDEGIDLNVLT